MNLLEQMDDDSLLKRYVQLNDREALGVLFLRHANAAYTTALRICRNGADADDAVQNAFIKVMQNAGDFRGGSEFGVRAWMMRIVVGTCLDRIRSDARRRKREEKVADEGDDVMIPEVESKEPNVAEIAGPVIEELNSLPDRYRLPIWLHHYQGMSVKETAEALHVEEKTAVMQIYRGLGKLRGRLAERGVLVGTTSVVGALSLAPLDQAPTSLLTGISSIVRGASVVAPGKVVAASSALRKVLAVAAIAMIAAGGGALYWYETAGAAPVQKATLQQEMPRYLMAYSFRGEKREKVADVSGVGEACDLSIGQPANVQWLGDAVRFSKPADVACAGEMKKLRDTWKKNKALSVEAWVRFSGGADSKPGARYMMQIRTSGVILVFSVDAQSVPVGAVGQAVWVCRDTADASETAFFSGGGKKGHERRLPQKIALDSRQGEIELCIASSKAPQIAGGKETECWPGDLIALRVYGKALSQEEMRLSYEAGPPK